MGQTKRPLRVGYNSTLFGVFIDALCYMNTFEALPACDIGVGALLEAELGTFQKPESPKLQAQPDEKGRWKGMAESVSSTRDKLEGLGSLAPVILRRKDSRLVMSPITAN